MTEQPSSLFRLWLLAAALASMAGALVGAWAISVETAPPAAAPERRPAHFQPRMPISTSGIGAVSSRLTWSPDATREEIADGWHRAGYRQIVAIERVQASPSAGGDEVMPRLLKAVLYNYEGEPRRAYDELQQMRDLIEPAGDLADEWLGTVIFYQGVTSLRLGENENCILCRGESSCILPISPAAVHTKQDGSRQAIRHFEDRELLPRTTPDPLDIRRLLRGHCLCLLRGNRGRSHAAYANHRTTAAGSSVGPWARYSAPGERPRSNTANAGSR
jgi:hypothetical protein